MIHSNLLNVCSDIGKSRSTPSVVNECLQHDVSIRKHSKDSRYAGENIPGGFQACGRGSVGLRVVKKHFLQA